MPKATEPVHVAVGVVVGEDGHILIARRPDSVHQGGRWEFPGGKVEPGEPVPRALERELYEELGIRPRAAGPLIRILHHYPDKSVLLDVWRITDFTGEPHGREGQPIRWVAPGQLPEYRFPDANHAIVTAASLPDRYLITPEPGPDTRAFLARLERLLAGGVRLLQLRAHGLDRAAYGALARQVAVRAREHGARLLLNAEPALALELGVGVHLTSRALSARNRRPLPPELPVAASCHDSAELAQAVALGADFAVLGPVAPTRSHPGVAPLGLDTFGEWVRDVPIPVYALGGMTPADVEAVQAVRGQGIAAIRGIWGG